MRYQASRWTCGRFASRPQIDMKRSSMPSLSSYRQLWSRVSPEPSSLMEYLSNACKIAEATSPLLPLFGRHAISRSPISWPTSIAFLSVANVVLPVDHVAHKHKNWR